MMSGNYYVNKLIVWMNVYKLIIWMDMYKLIIWMNFKNCIKMYIIFMCVNNDFDK